MTVDSETAGELNAKGCLVEDLTSFTERETSTQVQATEEVSVKSKFSFTGKVQFTEAREEYEQSLNYSSGDETISGESGTFEPV